MTLKEFEKEVGFSLSSVLGTGSPVYQKIRAEMLKGSMSEDLRKTLYEAIAKTADEKIDNAVDAKRWRFPEDRNQTDLS